MRAPTSLLPPDMSLVDTHCHLQDEAFAEDRETVLQQALDVLDWVVVVGDDLESSRRAVALTRDRVYAAVAFHPYYAEHVDGGSLAALEELGRTPRVRAIGEIGLDYHNVYAPPAAQIRAFRSQLELACSLHLPVVIHNRDAHEDVAAILEEYQTRLAGGVMHCFAGDPAFAERCVSWGFYVSFAGNLTFPKAEELRRAAAVVPVDRLLVETDSPYLAPQPVRGRRCEPAYVRHTAAALAAVKGLSEEELGRVTTENAGRLFRVDQV